MGCNIIPQFSSIDYYFQSCSSMYECFSDYLLFVFDFISSLWYTDIWNELKIKSPDKYVVALVKIIRNRHVKLMWRHATFPCKIRWKKQHLSMIVSRGVFLFCAFSKALLGFSEVFHNIALKTCLTIYLRLACLKHIQYCHEQYFLRLSTAEKCQIFGVKVKLQIFSDFHDSACQNNGLIRCKNRSGLVSCSWQKFDFDTLPKNFCFKIEEMSNWTAVRVFQKDLNKRKTNLETVSKRLESWTIIDHRMRAPCSAQKLKESFPFLVQRKSRLLYH